MVVGSGIGGGFAKDHQCQPHIKQESQYVLDQPHTKQEPQQDVVKPVAVMATGADLRNNHHHHHVKNSGKKRTVSDMKATTYDPGKSPLIFKSKHYNSIVKVWSLLWNWTLVYD